MKYKIQNICKKIIILIILFVILFGGRNYALYKTTEVKEFYNGIVDSPILGDKSKITEEEKKIYLEGICKVGNYLKEKTVLSSKEMKNNENLVIAYYNTKSGKIVSQGANDCVPITIGLGETNTWEIITNPIFIPIDFDENGNVKDNVSATTGEILISEMDADNTTLLEALKAKAETLSSNSGKEENQLDDESKKRADAFLEIVKGIVNAGVDKDLKDGTAEYASIINDVKKYFPEITDDKLVWEYEQSGDTGIYRYGTGTLDYVFQGYLDVKKLENLKIQDKLNELRNDENNITWTKAERDYILKSGLPAINSSAAVQEKEERDEEDDMELWEKIISAIIQIVAVVGDAVDQLMAYFMYGLDSGSFFDYNILIDEPEIESSDNVMMDIGKMKKDVKYPRVQYSPEEIFANCQPSTGKKIALLDINFIKASNADDYTSKNAYNDRQVLKTNIANWYTSLRYMAIVGLLGVLIYSGIKMIISSTSKNKANYKQMLVDWLMAFVILFSMHFIMALIFTSVESINKLFIDSNSNTYTVTVKGDDTKEFKTNLMGAVRFGIQSKEMGAQLMYLMVYFALVAYTVKFTFVYIKRTLRVAFLTLIGPIVAFTYPIDKMGDGKAQGFDSWIKEFAFNALIQPVHFLMYKILVTNSIYLVTANPIYAIMVLAFMTEAEQIFRQIFGFESRGGGKVGGLSTAGAIATGAIADRTIRSISKFGNKAAKEGKEKELKDMEKPDNSTESADYKAFGRAEEDNERDEEPTRPIRRAENPIQNSNPEENNRENNENTRNSRQRGQTPNPEEQTRTEEEKNSKEENKPNPFAELLDKKILDPFANKVKNIASAPSRKAKNILKNAGVNVDGNKDWKKQMPKNITKASKNKLARKLGWDKSRGNVANVARLAAKTVGAATRLTVKVGLGSAVTAAVLGASLADGKANPFKALGTGILAAKTGGKLMKKGEKIVGKAINGTRNTGRMIKYGDKNAYHMKYVDAMRNDKRTDDYFIRTYGIDKKDDEKERWIQHFYGLDAKEYKKARAFSNELSKKDAQKEMDSFRKIAEKTKQQQWENQVSEKIDENGNKMTKGQQAMEIAQNENITYQEAINKLKVDEYRKKRHFSDSVSDQKVEEQMKKDEEEELNKEEKEYKKRIAEKVRQETGEKELTDDEAIQRKYMDKNDNIAKNTVQGKKIIQEENAYALYGEKERQNYISDKLDSAQNDEERKQVEYYYKMLFDNIKKYDEISNH